MRIQLMKKKLLSALNICKVAIRHKSVRWIKCCEIMIIKLPNASTLTQRSSKLILCAKHRIFSEQGFYTQILNVLKVGEAQNLALLFLITLSNSQQLFVGFVLFLFGCLFSFLECTENKPLGNSREEGPLHSSLDKIG